MAFLDLIKDIMESGRDRLKSPLTGAYTIFFLLYNWRPILILLFSDAKTECKIEIIDKEYCRSEAIVYPFVFALLYVTILPYLSSFIERVVSKSGTSRLNLKYLKIEEEIKLKIRIARKENDLQDEKARNNEKNELIEENQKLKSDIESFKNEINTINASNSTIIKGYQKRINEMIDMMDKNDSREFLIDNDFTNYFENLVKHNLDKEDILNLSKLPNNSDEPLDINLPDRIFHFLDQNDFLFVKDKQFFMSEFGVKFINFLRLIPPF